MFSKADLEAATWLKEVNWDMFSTVDGDTWKYGPFHTEAYIKSLEDENVLNALKLTLVSLNKENVTWYIM